MVAIECALVLHLIKWFVVTLTLILTMGGCIKGDTGASVSQVSRKLHHSVVEYKNVDVESELVHENNYH
jgi:hypothetical protein